MDEFHTQTIVDIPVKDLVLWTENPRDPIDESATDQEVVERAYADPRGKWNLHKFVTTMGDFYDYSELPTVVYKNGKPVVYDGNRRIALAKIKLGYVKHLQTMDLVIPDFPEVIPCAVCSEETAIFRILRKHSLTGSWDELEREKFERKYFPQTPKSPFLLVEEALGVISSNGELNQNFVKKEIFTESNLKMLGFAIENGKLTSKHSNEDNLKIINDIVDKIKEKTLSTRNSRGQVFNVLDDDVKQIIKKDESKQNHLIEPIESDKPSEKNKTSQPRYTKRTHPKKNGEIFGEKLGLKSGPVNDLYRDICDLYLYWQNKQNSPSPLSGSFTALIRMSLRLLTETAAKDLNSEWDISNYIDTYFAQAKQSLTQDQKTSLSNYVGESRKVIQLLQTGAHNYQAAQNIDQTLILSVIIAKMLKITHGQGGA